MLFSYLAQSKILLKDLDKFFMDSISNNTEKRGELLKSEIEKIQTQLQPFCLELRKYKAYSTSTHEYSSNTEDDSANEKIKVILYVIIKHDEKATFVSFFLATSPNART